MKIELRSNVEKIEQPDKEQKIESFLSKRGFEIPPGVNLSELINLSENPYFFETAILSGTDQKTDDSNYNNLIFGDQPYGVGLQFTKEAAESLTKAFLRNGVHGYGGHYSHFSGWSDSDHVVWVAAKAANGQTKAIGLSYDDKVSRKIKAGLAINKPIGVSISATFDPKQAEHNLTKKGKKFIVFKGDISKGLESIDLIEHNMQADKKAKTTAGVQLADGNRGNPELDNSMELNTMDKTELIAALKEHFPEPDNKEVKTLKGEIVDLKEAHDKEVKELKKELALMRDAYVTAKLQLSGFAETAKTTPLITAQTLEEINGQVTALQASLETHKTLSMNKGDDDSGDQPKFKVKNTE